ncbi:PP2C family protein-serine/threonine phosphatase [Streptomyces sp. ME19-01-6]|uniref:PP2C family protein-serine/threonine phosphatase n=1 Tax=Streptomyces sp. ME19-01-6 TaxID=3028686 RepID=UPI0029AE82A1|nr:SpoIIE family protein phosphatase [Streptomyces sp. ME19-01-6]MDX3228100.1 SpoIIE family protein phosphatase [Streptomyces sp. ME19-01-6]
MPPPRSADHSAAQPPQPPWDTVDALISQTRRLRGGVDAVRRDTTADIDHTDDPQLRWQRALCDLAVHHLDDLGHHLDQLREGLPTDPAEAEAPSEVETATNGGPGARSAPEPPPPPGSAYATPARDAGPQGHGSLLSRVGSAEWDLLTDAVTWSDELYQIFDRAPEDGGLTLDELPSWVFSEDQPTLTALVTDCLVDGKPIDGEFRVVRADGVVRTVHMSGEPVLDDDGSTASMWAVLRDVSELRRSERAVRETRDSLRRQRHIAQTERRVAVELQEAVLPVWRGSPRLSPGGATALDLAAHYFPASTSTQIGGDWYDALELPDGRTLLSVGDLTGHGVAATSGVAMLLGAVRGMAVAGVEPGALMGWLNQLLDASAQPALGSAVCGRYDPVTRTLEWAQAAHPAPLLFRDGTGRALQPPEGVLLGATPGATYTQHGERLEPGDLLVLHTGGLWPFGADADGDVGAERLLGLAPRFATARSAQECVRAVVEAFEDERREDDACVLIARISS